jgi:hypothetical protein
MQQPIVEPRHTHLEKGLFFSLCDQYKHNALKQQRRVDAGRMSLTLFIKISVFFCFLFVFLLTLGVPQAILFIMATPSCGF